METIIRHPEATIPEVQFLLRKKNLDVKTGFVYECKRHVSLMQSMVGPRWKVDPDTIPNDKLVIGFITDTHLPAEVDGYLEWVIDMFVQRGVNCIIHGGDLFDFHAASRHLTEDDAHTQDDELDLVSYKLKPWVEAFPYMKIIEGNHDLIPRRQAKSIGLSGRFIKSYHELFGLPDTWSFHEKLVINGVKFIHGDESGGMYGAINTALADGGSVAQGHTHAYGGILYRASDRRLLFGLNGGCGCDTKSYAMRYGAKNKFKGTVGCSVIYNRTYAEFIPMPL